MTSNRPTNYLFVGLTLATAAFVALLPKPGKPTAQSVAAKADGGTGSPTEAQPSRETAFDSPLKPFYDFLGLQTPLPPSPETAAKRYTLEREQGKLAIVEKWDKPDNRAGDPLYSWPNEKHLKGYSFRFLIASVPDPVSSGFAYRFDQLIEALQRALAADNLVIDQAWLPWRRANGLGKSATSLQEKHPGVILFRTAPDQTAANARPQKQRLLALLLVGETATTGVNQTAFRNAVRIIRNCQAHKEEGNRARVIGPYFSGSSVSLRRALENACDETNWRGVADPPVKVVCGSAAAFDVKWFCEGWAKNGKQRAFETTILPDKLVLRHLWSYLDNPIQSGALPPASPTPTVVLYEGSTERGQRNRQNNPEKDTMIWVPFPFHISQLRAAYTREQLTRLVSLGLPHSGRNLPFPHEEGQSKETLRGVLKAQSPLMTATVADLVLNNLVATLKQWRIRRVCLVSTDPQDTIFLAQVIRNLDPDIQLVGVGHDLLFTHDDYGHALRGMIVAGTYSLYPGFQPWSDLPANQGRARPAFSSLTQATRDTITRRWSIWPRGRMGIGQICGLRW